MHKNFLLLFPISNRRFQIKKSRIYINNGFYPSYPLSMKNFPKTSISEFLDCVKTDCRLIAYFLYIECARACGGYKSSGGADDCDVNFIDFLKTGVVNMLGILNKSIRGEREGGITMKRDDLNALAHYYNVAAEAVGRWCEENKDAGRAEATTESLLQQVRKLEHVKAIITQWYNQLLEVRETMREYMAASWAYKKDPEHNEKPSLAGKRSSVYASIDDLSTIGRTMLWFTTVLPNDPDASAAAVEIWDDERNSELHKVLEEALEAKTRIEKQTDSRTGYSRRRREVG